jgi:hypothetical protein
MEYIGITSTKVCLGKINYTPHLRHAAHAVTHPRSHPILVLVEIVALRSPRVGKGHVGFDDELELSSSLPLGRESVGGTCGILVGMVLEALFPVRFPDLHLRTVRATPAHPHQPRAHQQQPNIFSPRIV